MIDFLEQLCYNDMRKRCLHMEIKNILKQLRESKGLTMQEVAEKTDISYSVYQKYESGVRGVGVPALQKLADLYNISTDCLLGRQTADTSTSPLQQLIDKFQLTKDQAALLVAYLNMNESDRENLIRCIKVLARGIQ